MRKSIAFIVVLLAVGLLCSSSYARSSGRGNRTDRTVRSARRRPVARPHVGVRPRHRRRRFVRRRPRYHLSFRVLPHYYYREVPYTYTYPRRYGYYDYPTYEPQVARAEITGIFGLPADRTVSGYAGMGIVVSEPSRVRSVRLYVDDRLVNTDRTFPYYLGGDVNGVPRGFDTRRLSNGGHTLRVALVRTDGSETQRSWWFDVRN